jgi:CBS domain-containing protein
MLGSIIAKDYMSINPVTFRADTDIFSAIHILLQHKISGATVINDNNEVVGVISEMDCLKAIINVGYYGEGGGFVGDFMTASVESIDKNINIVDAAQLLLSTKRRRVPVIEAGKFTGQISARSILQAFKDIRSTHDSAEDNRYE